MNVIFLTFYLIAMVVTLLFDIRKLRSQKPPLKRLYYLIFALAFGVYFCFLLGYQIPMPTSFFIHKVSPWVFSKMQH
ncbi:hypothetical protein ACFQ88_33295 [Paenibacillus sp. NPDC056579]|uniref:hypothetical protein n=1 Tax=unclassified Paenibacillus TaxID=185978 RepID=UPI001EF78EA8|nr:hypothetical protein [Paenibacillus sp. H1-7]ULL13637.1 hypothetical protein DVH26_03735 [Paenibacillus sp. H1-7]